MDKNVILNTFVILYCAPVFITTTQRGVIVFSSVCLLVCLTVCEHDNFGTVRDIITIFLCHHPVIKREAMFENACIRMCRWRENFSDVF